MPCRMMERGWGGFVLDLITIGGFTLYRSSEYSIYLDNLSEEELAKVVKTMNPKFNRGLLAEYIIA